MKLTKKQSKQNFKCFFFLKEVGINLPIFINKQKPHYIVFSETGTNIVLEMYYRPEYLWAILIVNMDQLYIGLSPNLCHSDLI